MAQVKIVGRSFVIVSSVTKANLETVKKLRPSALALTDPDTKETLFRVGLGKDSLSSHGICFGGVANTDEPEQQYATATFQIPEGVENAKEHVMDIAGPALVSLKKVEDGLSAVLADVRAEREGIAASITVEV